MKRTNVFCIVISLFITSISYSQNDVALKQAISYYENGQTLESLKIYDSLIKIKKYEQLCYYNKGIILLDLQNTNKAYRALKRAIKIDKSNEIAIDAIIKYTDDLMSQNKHLNAYFYLTKYLIRVSKHPEILLQRGKASTNMKKFDDAESDFVNAIIKDSIFADGHLELAYFHYNQYRIISLLAFLRYFSLQPRNQENEEVYQDFIKLIYNRDYDVNLNIPIMDKNIYANDFREANKILTSAKHDIKKDDNELVKIYKILSFLFKNIERNTKGYGFYWNYYVPYFLELNNKGYLKKYVFLLLSKSDLNASENVKYFGTLNDYYDWDRNYIWIKK